MRGALQNGERLQALRAFGHKITCRYGIVTGYDPNKYAAKATLDDAANPDGVATGFLPIAAVWAGNGWGFFAPPAMGSQVVLCFVDGDFTAGFVLCQCFNSTTSPLPVPAGELWIVHKNGQFAKFTNDGKLTFSDGQGATLEFDGSGNLVTAANNWTHTGPVTIEGDTTITGDISISGTLESTGDGTVDGVNIKTHTHGGVTSGSSPTGPPV